MNRDQARNLIKTTFTRAFDKENFRTFTLNVLNRIDESKAQTWSTQYVKDAFKPHVQRYERLGTYTSPNKEKLDVLIVHLTNESKLERARTAIRNFVADHLKTRDEKEAALVAFVSPTEEQWRFSYVKMDYATVEKESRQTRHKEGGQADGARPNGEGGRGQAGKAGPERSRRVGVETRLTPARRFSYLVGEGESSHTAQSRFVDLLRDTETDPPLAQIEEAFSVEAVTKEFFTKYAELFEQIEKALTKLVDKDKTLGDEFNAKQVSTVDFAKKLMGQIVFLYFLQKKGWLGVQKDKEWGTGPRDFLRRLASGQYAKYDNFFNDVLEPLFYDTLAADRGHEAWDKRFNCRIPFLNGGLFEPLGDYDWQKTDIILPNKLFTNNEFVEEGITGTGVLDVFDRYNFTVNEAEPLEKEVAIDPEMLGKVFENLIEENRRKGLGSYYTPREIVHYMCQESLINYLDTAVNSSDVIANGVKQSDSTENDEIASSRKAGTRSDKKTIIVPRTDIETFVHLGEQISHYEAVEAEYRVKMPKSIQKHAKLIDEKLAGITVCDPAVGSGAFPVGMMTEIVRARMALTPYFNDVHERTPYHFKRHAIQNCLYGVDIDASAVEIAKLRLWLSLVVDEEDVKQIKPLPNLDYKIVSGNSLVGIEVTLFNAELFGRLESLKPLYFNESDKSKKVKYKIEIDNLIHELTGGKSTFDFEVLFSEVFHTRNGFDVTIGNPPYVSYYSRESASNKSVEKELLSLRKAFTFTRYETKKGRLNLWMFFAERFIKLNCVNGVATFLADVNFTKDVARNIRRYLTERSTIKQFIHDLSEFENVASGQVILFVQQQAPPKNNMFLVKNSIYDGGSLRHQSELKPPTYDFLSELNDPVLVKLSNIRTIGRIEALNLVTGVQVGGTEYYNGKMIKDHFYRPTWDCKTVFPSVSVKSVTRYSHPTLDKGILFDYDLATEITKFTQKSAVVLQKYEKFLPVEKILIRQSAPSLVATIGGKNCCGEYSLFSMITRPKVLHLYYLLGLLNSTLLSYVARKSGVILSKKGTQPQIRKAGLERLPVVLASDSQQEKVAKIVTNILRLKKSDPQSDTTSFERDIDQLVYNLYRLTEEEIKIVEGRQ